MFERKKGLNKEYSELTKNKGQLFVLAYHSTSQTKTF